MSDNPYLPVPPGLIEDVAKRCHETMCEAASVTTSDGRGSTWDSMEGPVHDAWRAVARQAIATTLNRMIHEGWAHARHASITTRDGPSVGAAAMSARRELLVLERLLWRLSEMARHASTQCSSNAILPLGAERLACQV